MKVGIMLPVTERGDEQAPSYATVRDIAQTAEAVGFDSIWLPDHYLYRKDDQPFMGFWEAWTLLTALAEATTRVELGPLVLCTAFRNPAFLAKQATTLDEISGGRLILGLGAGWNQPEFDATGIPFDRRVDRFEEAVQIIKPLVRDGYVDFTGTHYAAPDNVNRPRGGRPNGPPLLFGAKKPRMMRLTARYADAWNTCWLGQPEAIDAPLEQLRAACAAEGRDFATLQLTVSVSVVRQPANPDQPLNPQRDLWGSADDIAAGLRGYAERGIHHLICWLEPNTVESVRWLGEVVQQAGVQSEGERGR